MAILRDHLNNRKLLDFQITKRNKNLDQGCNILVTITDPQFENDVAVDFGWTNQTLSSFIKMLDHFPMELYNGYFSHYDESFEWKWYYEQTTDLYLIIIFLSGWIPNFKVSLDDLKKFSALILMDIEQATEYEK